MITVAVQDEFAEVLTVFGDLQETVDDALRQYTVQQIVAKIAELRRRDAEYQTRYGMDYPTFVQRIGEDSAFVKYVEEHINKMWENDLLDWEYSYKGIQEWTQKLQNILSI
ncbi:MAG: hypothetical protein GXP42_03580 [Chloroflexi bacterium]|nr:hypothetical protein [Chloroflexota bacterium]